MWITRPALAAVVLAGAAASAQAQEIKSEGLYKKVLPSVMTLNVDKQGTLYSGTAFLSIKNGLAVTAWHVVKGATRVTAKFATGEEFDVSGLVDKDEKRDVALVRVKVFGRPPLRAITADPEVGSKAYVMGAPRGLDFSISDGLVSQIQTIDGVKQFQFSCPASPGNSGGPLVNSKGEVIGVVSWQYRDGQNLNFAVPITYVLGLDASLPTQPWDSVKPSVSLGLKRASASDEELDRLYAKTIVTILDTETAIAYAESEIIRKPDGFKNGVPSCVYSFNRELSSVADALDKTSGSDPLKEKLRPAHTRYCRAMAEGLDLMGQAIRSAQLGGGWNPTANDLYSRSRAAIGVSPDFEIGEAVKILESQGVKSKLPLTARHLLGLEREPAPFNLGIKVWLNNSLSVVVVLKDSLAEKIGFRSGDQILAAQNKTFNSLSEFKCILKENAGKQLRVTIEREGGRRDIEVSVPQELPAH